MARGDPRPGPPLRCRRTRPGCPARSRSHPAPAVPRCTGQSAARSRTPRSPHPAAHADRPAPDDAAHPGSPPQSASPAQPGKLCVGRVSPPSKQRPLRRKQPTIIQNRRCRGRRPRGSLPLRRPTPLPGVQPLPNFLLIPVMIQRQQLVQHIHPRLRTNSEPNPLSSLVKPMPQLNLPPRRQRSGRYPGLVLPDRRIPRSSSTAYASWAASSISI